MAHSAYPVPIDGGLNVEGHAGLKNVWRFWMDAWQGVGIGCRKTDPVACWMAKFSTESMPDENAARRSIHRSGLYSGRNQAQRGGPGLSNCALHMLLLLRRTLHFNDEGTSNVGPVAIANGIRVDHHQVALLKHTAPSTRIGTASFGGIWSGHAEEVASPALKAVMCYP